VHETHFVRILEENFPLCVKIFSEYRQERNFSFFQKELSVSQVLYRVLQMIRAMSVKKVTHCKNILKI
jgi:hypothetical protein